MLCLHIEISYQQQQQLNNNSTTTTKQQQKKDQRAKALFSSSGSNRELLQLSFVTEKNSRQWQLDTL
jgi:hypothetical protein